MHWQYKQCILKVQENMKFCVELWNRKDTIQKVLNDLYVLWSLLGTYKTHTSILNGQKH